MLINIHKLAALLLRATETIRKDSHRNPAAVPPRGILPGARLLRWHPAVIDVWLRSRVQGGSK